ncbi:hypothetical protein [Helicovermis profundi]|uniref:Phosphoadenosine phosphosulphate reductase domain-containing protein n=1 Tax=Helicovermis profundi TaxID=3065157 RepID=A0AAU9E9K8_9FIRM|nr:hypothetical protein HLPR_02650 [Clostridia bacterium S502]
MIKQALKKFIKENYNKQTLVGEFSGRDSVGAILKAFESEDINYVLPIASFSGTEYGNFDEIYSNYEHLSKRVDKLYGDKKVLYPLLEYNREDIWSLMNGRFMTVLNKKYGFYSHCIGCHLYFHLIKINFAKSLSGKIISGERESHDGRLKINQLGITLDAFKKVINKFDCELIMPIRNISDGDEVEKLIGWDWKEGEDHPKCVLSGNYRDKEGHALINKVKLELFLSEYIEEVGKIIGRYLIEESKNLRKISDLKEEVNAII